MVIGQISREKQHDSKRVKKEIDGQAEASSGTDPVNGLFSRGEFEEGAELVRARRMPQLAQHLGLDLADALAGDGQHLAHFLERVLAAVLQPEAHLDDLFLAGSE